MRSGRTLRLRDREMRSFVDRMQKNPKLQVTRGVGKIGVHESHAGRYAVQKAMVLDRVIRSFPLRERLLVSRVMARWTPERFVQFYAQLKNTSQRNALELVKSQTQSALRQYHQSLLELEKVREHEPRELFANQLGKVGNRLQLFQSALNQLRVRQ